MDRSDKITLVAQTFVKDEYGVQRPTEERRDVYCQVDSVTRSEFYEGGRAGLNPEYRFTMFFGDYDGEEIVIYNGKAYSVYRTYIARDDRLELYVERKGGTNGANGNG